MPGIFIFLPETCLAPWCESTFLSETCLAPWRKSTFLSETCFAPWRKPAFLPETCLISIPADLKGKENEETVEQEENMQKEPDRKTLLIMEDNVEFRAKPFNFEVLQTRIEMLTEQQEKRKRLFREELDVQPGSITTTSLDKEFIGKRLN